MTQYIFNLPTPTSSNADCMFYLFISQVIYFLAFALSKISALKRGLHVLLLEDCLQADKDV